MVRPPVIPINPAGGGGGGTIAVSDPIARWTGTPGNGTDITSASFTPANNSLLVVCISADSSSSSAAQTIAVSGGSLTWTARVERNAGESGANGGYAGIFTAPVSTGASMTVSVRRSAGTGGSNRLSAKVYVVTGQNASPIGTNGEGSSGTNNLSAAAYTSTVNNSRAFGAATDWNALGAGSTNPTSTDSGSPGATYSGQIDALSVYKAADTATSGTAVTLNFDAAGASAPLWNWCALEIVP